MSTAADVALARRFAEFERRLQGLERGTRLDRAAIVVDDTGRSVGVTGAVVAGSREGALLAARALTGLLPMAAGVARSVYFTAEEPVAAIAEDLWLRSDNVLVQLGGVWVELADQSGVPAIAALRSALTTDDGRIVVWVDAAYPTGGPAPAFGDLWLQAATVSYRWEGDAGWQPLVPPEGQSLNYVAGEEGWTITPDGDSQFRDLSALGQVSGNAGSFDTLEVGGVNILATLGDSSIGKLLGARLALQGSNIGMSTTKTKIMELNCGLLPGGRTYRVKTDLLLVSSGTLALTDRATFVYHYTTDGTAPNTSSPRMDGGFNDAYTVLPAWQSFNPQAELDLATTGPLRVGIFSQVLAGAGAYTIYAGASAASRPVMSLYDDGPLGTRNDAAITLTGGGLARYSKTFNASWVFGISDVYPSTSYITVGDGEYGIGGMYGLIGFDSAAIVAGLSGSLTPISLTLRWRCRTRKTAGGLDTRLVSHNYSSRALAEAAIQYPEGGWSNYPLTALTNVNNAVPNTVNSTSLGTGVFGQFKAATKKGIGFVTQIADTYAQTPDGSGTIWGDGTNECQLVFVYDGTS